MILSSLPIRRDPLSCLFSIVDSAMLLIINGILRFQAYVIVIMEGSKLSPLKDCTQYTRKRIYQVQEICTIDPIFLYPFGFEISLKKFRKKKIKKKNFNQKNFLDICYFEIRGKCVIFNVVFG